MGNVIVVQKRAAIDRKGKAMRLRMPALWTGAAIGALVLISPAPVSAAPLSTGLNMGLAKATVGSSVVLVKNKGKGKGQFKGKGKGRGNFGRNAAAVGAAAAVLGFIGAAAQADWQAKIDRCRDQHSDVNERKGVWYDRRGREHPCR
jgi:hypothetical protein